ncbi:ATP-binding protein [Brevibacillus humidisoli]|uniref:ATP-binding protein n=1 Tax=Brevibacillus humidisoli TaxID=2895522 RepID=UPI001E41D54A|nr:ATP-binding protein [Brevibacillus humidisoli]UFJ39064.1 ATP-binding protein [Brevibacillus humidisoli]
MAQKVIPPRRIRLVHLTTGKKVIAELRAVSRIALGVYISGQCPPGRYEIELDTDFRIIGSTVRKLSDTPYQVVDIEKVLRKQEVLDRLLLEEFHLWHLSHELEPSEVLADPSDLAEEQKQLIKQELDKLFILRQIHDIRMFIWKKGNYQPLGEFFLDSSCESDMNRLIERALASGEPIREQLLAQEMDRVFDVHVVPLQKKSCGIAMIDITDMVTTERKRQRQEWDLYKQVLSIVTENKLVLLQDVELYELIRQSDRQSTIYIEEAADLARVRQAIREVLEVCQLSPARLLHFIVAVNEAATNTITHGEAGRVDIYLSEKEQVCRIVVFDQGTGISLSDLPQVTLLPGYSTRASLGAGFQVMLSYADRVLLNSSPMGTKIVLELNTSQATAPKRER